MKERVSERVLEQWFQDLEDGIIGPGEHQALTELLLSSPEARAKFREHMAFTSAMYTEAEAFAKLHGFPERMPEKEQRKRRLSSRVLAAVTVAVLLLIAGSMVIRWPLAERSWLVAEKGAVWTLVSGRVDGRRGIEAGTEIEIQKGTVEMMTAAGSRVMVEGPGRLIWEGKKSVRLVQGQLWAEVQEPDHGLEVWVGDLKVTDLGTGFGVDFQAEGTEVHVERGRVRLERAESEEGGAEMRELSTGQAVRVSREKGIQAVACDPERFIRSLPQGPDYIRWSFEEVKPEGFASEGRGWDPYKMHVLQPDGQSGVAVLTEGVFGYGVDLEASGGWLTAEFEGILGSAPRTLALWVKFNPLKGWWRADGFPVNPALAGWGEDWEQAKWDLVTSRYGGEIASVWGGSWVTSQLPQRLWLADGEWHHVASVFTGRHDEAGNPEVWHYLDGKKMELNYRRVYGPVHTQVNRAKRQGLHVGRVSGTAKGMELVPLKVDEVVVVRRALSEGEVRMLFEHNRLPGEMAEEKR